MEDKVKMDDQGITTETWKEMSNGRGDDEPEEESNE